MVDKKIKEFWADPVNQGPLKVEVYETSNRVKRFFLRPRVVDIPSAIVPNLYEAVSHRLEKGQYLRVVNVRSSIEAN